MKLQCLPVREEMAQHSVRQTVPIMTGARIDRHGTGLFHDKQTFVFKGNGKGNPLRFHRTGRRRDGKGDTIPALQDGARRGRFAVAQETALYPLGCREQAGRTANPAAQKAFERSTAV